MTIEERDNSFEVPDLSQDGVFALIDEFYGATPPRATDTATEQASAFGDDDFADLMQNLDDIEKFAQLPDTNVPMPDAFPSFHTTNLPNGVLSVALAPRSEMSEDRTASLPTSSMQDESPPELGADKPITTSPDFTSGAERLEQQHVQASLSNTSTHDVSATRHSPTPPGTEPPASDPANGTAICEEQQLQTPSMPDLPMHGTSHLSHCSTSNNRKPPVASTGLTPAPSIAGQRTLKTPIQATAQHVTNSTHLGTVPPSTGGDRSSLQGEMRQEEHELLSSEVGSLPPFPGFQMGDDPDRNASERHLREAHDLENSGNIAEQQAAASANSPPKQELGLPLPPLKNSPEGQALSVIDKPAPIASKRVRRASSPLNMPAKRPRQLPWIQVKRKAEVTEASPIEESDSSLTDISLSLLGTRAAPPEQIGKSANTAMDETHHRTAHERKDSFATELREFKQEPPSSPVKNTKTPEQKPAKPKAAPKRKRNDTATASASPAPSKATKVTKTASTHAKAKKPGNELKGIIEAGILGDVLKNKGSRKTRGQQKASDSAKPDAALAAKRRHTGQVNYKE